MDSIEWNKFAGWTLAAFLTMMVLGWASSSVFHHERQEKPALVPEGCEGDRTCGGGKTVEGPAEVEVPLPNLLMAATAAKGEAIFKQCSTCHSIGKGEAAKTGPNLWGVVGRNHGIMPGYAYSSAMAAKSGEKWTWEAMNAWLTNPKAAIAGNKMSFGGISKAESRAALLVYLNSNSDAPMALPPAVAVAAPAAKPAEAAAAAIPGAAAPAPAAPAK